MEPAVTPVTAARLRLSPRLATIALAAMIVALTAFIVLSAMLDGTFSAAHLWSATSLMVIIMVTAAVGLVVVGHQPRNPIGWLLGGEAIFMLLNIAAGDCWSGCTPGWSCWRRTCCPSTAR